MLFFITFKNSKFKFKIYLQNIVGLNDAKFNLFNYPTKILFLASHKFFNLTKYFILLYIIFIIHIKNKKNFIAEVFWKMCKSRESFKKKIIIICCYFIFMCFFWKQKMMNSWQYFCVCMEFCDNIHFFHHLPTIIFISFPYFCFFKREWQENLL